MQSGDGLHAYGFLRHVKLQPLPVSEVIANLVRNCPDATRTHRLYRLVFHSHCARVATSLTSRHRAKVPAFWLNRSLFR